MILVPTDDTLKKYEEMWSKIKDLISSITNTSHDYDEKYIKIKFNSDSDLPLNKTLKLYNRVIVVRSVFMKATDVTRKFSWKNVC